MAVYTLFRQGAAARVKSRGGEFSSFVPPGGKEYIWQGDRLVWGGQSPLLFPIVCAARDNRVNIKGAPYEIKKHGFMMLREFEPTAQGEDFITLSASSDEETLARYPFHFTLSVTHRLFADGFSTTFTVKNESGETMPFCIGGHPGFVCPREEGEAFSDYILEFPEAEKGESLYCPTGYLVEDVKVVPEFSGNTLPLTHDYFDRQDALMLAGLRSRSVKLIHKDTRKGLEFFFPDFPVLGVWSKPGAKADYVCLEPWCGTPAAVWEGDDFEQKPHVQFLPPGAEQSFTYRMKVIG